MDALLRNGWFAAAALLGVTWVIVGATDAAAYALIPGLAALLAAAGGVITRSVRWGVVAASALGAACGAYLFKLKLDHATQAACDIGETLSCTGVNASAWSEVGGVSIGLIGAAFYTGLLAAAVFGGRDEGRFAQLTALFSIPAVLYSIVLAGVSVQLGTFCVVCVTMYGVNLLLAWAGFRGLRQHDRKLLDDLGGLLADRQLGTLVVVFAVLLFAGRAQAPSGAGEVALPTTPRGAPDYASLYTSSPEVEIPPGTPRKGPADARYQVLEFADFACPHCARASQEFDELLQVRPDVSVRFLPFALSGQCNPALPPDTSDMGRLRCAAALAAECAHRQDRFWEMTHQLFTNQGYFEADQLRFMAQEIGLDVPRWEACMASPEALQAVQAAGEVGASLGIRGTPAIFLRGLFDDGRWVQVTRGVHAVLQLVEAHADGAELPAPDGA